MLCDLCSNIQIPRIQLRSFGISPTSNTPSKPIGVYRPCLVDGRYLYLSGHGFFKEDGTLIIGKVGKDLDVLSGKMTAGQVGLAMLSTIKANLGSLNRVKRVIKVLGMVIVLMDLKSIPI